jgi:hypothetical protein
MCGIIGFLGIPNNTYEVLKVKYLLHMNEWRGKDATGIWNIKDKLQKNLDKVEDFILNNNIKWTEDNILLGHCRSASSGTAKSIDGAHPHEYSNLVGVHNGTLRYCYDLTSKYNNDKFGKCNNKINYNDFTDSQLLYKIINDTRSTKVLSHIEGSAALLFHDKNKPNVLYAFRKENSGTDERPLYYGFSSVPEHSGIYFSSILKSLKIIGCEDVKEIQAEGVSIFENGQFKEFIPIKKIKTSYQNSSSNNATNAYSHNVGFNFGSTNFVDNFKDLWFQHETTEEWLKYTGNIINKDKDNELFVCKDIDNKYVNVKKSDFPYKPRSFYFGEDVIFMIDIVDSNDNNNYLFIKNQVCRIKTVDYTNKKALIDTYFGDSREISFSYIRHASHQESTYYYIDNTDLTKSMNLTVDDVKKMIVNKTNKAKGIIDSDDDELNKQSDDLFREKLEKFKSDILVHLISDDKFLNKINNDYELLMQIDETIDNDYESIEFKISEIYDAVSLLETEDPTDNEPILDLVVDLLLTIVQVNT